MFRHRFHCVREAVLAAALLAVIVPSLAVAQSAAWREKAPEKPDKLEELERPQVDDFKMDRPQIERPTFGDMQTGMPEMKTPSMDRDSVNVKEEERSSLFPWRNRNTESTPAAPARSAQPAPRVSVSRPVAPSSATIESTVNTPAPKALDAPSPRADEPAPEAVPTEDVPVEAGTREGVALDITASENATIEDVGGTRPGAEVDEVDQVAASSPPEPRDVPDENIANNAKVAASEPAPTLASAAPAATVSAPEPELPAAEPVSAPGNIEILDYVAPEYPLKALRDRTDGWVDVAFTIAADGTVQNVSVENARPRRVFERAATRAVSQWRFTSPGQAPIQRTTRVEFSPN